MTRGYAAQKLLAHGALNINEFIEITGWQSGQCYRVLEWLRGRSLVTKMNHGLWVLKADV